jgi:hypothetical protein
MTEGTEHVLNEAGEFEIHDEAVDLSHYRIEDWLSFAIFWVLALVIFYQFVTRYALNDSASWTGGDRALPADRRRLRRRRRSTCARTTTSRSTSSTASCRAW